MYNLKNTTKLSDVLYTLLCVIRLLVFMPLILTCLCFVPLMYLLGIKNAIDKWVKLNEAIVFDVVGQSEQLPCGHKQVEFVRHAAKCKDCGTVFETKW